MQKTLSKTHKSIPNFPLHSTHSYQIFFKNYPKHVHKLDLDSTAINSLKPYKFKRILHNLIKLTRKSRNIKALQDVNLVKYFKARKSQAILIVKKFHRVHSLGLLWDFYDASIQRETRRWLKYIKKLQSLVFIHAKYRTRPRPSMIAPSKRLNQKLFRDIKQRRIISFTHSPSPGFPFIPVFKYNKGNYYALDMKDYPSSVKKIELNLAHCVIAFDEKLISMEKFSMLTRLELLFYLELKMALVILQSIPNPQILISLGLYLRNRFPEYDEEALIPIFEFITKNYSGLDKLNLRITHPTEKLKLLKIQKKLRVLNLWVSVKTATHLEDLKLFMFTHKNLESLDLTIDFDLNSVLSKENLQEFYEALGQLTQLKKLCLDFCPREEINIRPEYVQYSKIPESYQALMEAITYLTHLEEVSLRIPDSKSHLLGKALAQIASHLKRLEVSLNGQALDMDGNLEFINVFRKMMELRELSISRFSFEKEHNFATFKEILKGLRNIEKMRLDHFEIPQEGEEILGNLVLSMLKKKGLKEMGIKQNFQENVGKCKTTLLVDEILKKNPDLRVVKIESQTISHHFSFTPFESFKYV